MNDKSIRPMPMELCGVEKKQAFFANVAMPPAPVWAPVQRPVSRLSNQSDEKADNEVQLRNLLVPKGRRKFQKDLIGDLMKDVRTVISNVVPHLQMRSVGSHDT